jgi:hypothetical protein
MVRPWQAFLTRSSVWGRDRGPALEWSNSKVFHLGMLRPCPPALDWGGKVKVIYKANSQIRKTNSHGNSWSTSQLLQVNAYTSNEVLETNSGEVPDLAGVICSL